MNVFILGTGRCGTTTFIKACSHIHNYSCGHESRSRMYGEERFAYPAHHIEADNRLSWFLGAMDQKYGDDAFYIHLIRDKATVCKSFQSRWNYVPGIMDAFGHGIVMLNKKNISNAVRLQLTEFYYDTVNQNINLFLKDKTKKMTIHLENITDLFPQFWNAIAAEGILDNALKELITRYNATDK